jgi:hypothetical protein
MFNDRNRCMCLFVQRSESLYVQRSESLYAYVKQLLLSDRDRCMCMLNIVCSAIRIAVCSAIGIAVCVCEKRCFSDRDRCMCMLNNVCSAIRIAVCSAIGIAVCVCEKKRFQRSESLYVYVCVFFNDRNHYMYVATIISQTLATASIEIQLITVGPRRRGIYNSSTREFGNSCTRRIASHSIALPPWHRLHADHNTP